MIGWKKPLLASLVLVLMAVVWCISPAPALGFPPLGDTGKPADYNKTMKRFKDRMTDFATASQSLSPSFDFRDQGVVTPAKDQGNCGSCWAFATVGVFESKLLMAGAGSFDLSEQQQVSCNTSMAGCNGGNSTALRYWENRGPMEESCTGYPSTSGSSYSCAQLSACSLLDYYTKEYYTVDTSDVNEIKTSLNADGPAYFRFLVYGDFYTFWSTRSPGKVYKQASGTYQGGHAVLLIGWDDTKQAWLLKNSWGATAGPNGDGTFWMAYTGHANNLDFGTANVHLKTAETTGSLTVTISPAAAVTAGAQWQVDGGAWRNSGTTATGLTAGSHTVAFKAVTGWTTPASRTVTIVSGATATSTGTYTQSTGSLTVTITPAAAVTAGAQWQVDGGTWRNSGTTVSGLTTGTHTVAFKAVTGWNTPATKAVTITSGGTTTATGTYTQGTGSLTITITPAAAVTAGAQWQVDGGTWRNSGTTATGLAVGTHTVAFKALTGWTAPASKSVTISSGVTTTATGTYVQGTGSLTVTITPTAAVTAGAQWQVDGGTWRNSGTTATGLAAGTHTVAFKAVTGWNTPASKSVTITTGATTTATGTYTQGTGSLTVTITPAAAVTAGAQWQVDGGTWRNSGTSATGLAAGTHTVAFKALTGWNTPASKSVTITTGATTTATGTYTQGTGSLTVTITPAAAISAGAQWQVDGGTWRNSGTTVMGLAAGTHTVAFKALTGWTSPASKSVTITAGATATATGTYTQGTGSLTVTITPAAAISAGAQWRVDGGVWRNSGTTLTGLTAGTHTVSFKPISGWATPTNKSVTISSGIITTTTGNYTGTGSLRVSINPWYAMLYGAQWRVDSGPWQYGDNTVTGLSAGTHIVSFSYIYGWITPPSQVVTISPGMTTTTTGNYQMWMYQPWSRLGR